MHSLPMESSALQSGEGVNALQGFKRRFHSQSLEVMSAYPKQSLPVQFLPFGVEQHGIIVPILHRSRDNFGRVHKEDLVQVGPAPRERMFKSRICGGPAEPGGG